MYPVRKRYGTNRRFQAICFGCAYHSFVSKCRSLFATNGFVLSTLVGTRLQHARVPSSRLEVTGSIGHYHWSMIWAPLVGNERLPWNLTKPTVRTNFQRIPRNHQAVSPAVRHPPNEQMAPDKTTHRSVVLHSHLYRRKTHSRIKKMFGLVLAYKLMQNRLAASHHTFYWWNSHFPPSVPGLVEFCWRVYIAVTKIGYNTPACTCTKIILDFDKPDASTVVLGSRVIIPSSSPPRALAPLPPFECWRLCASGSWGRTPLGASRWLRIPPVVQTIHEKAEDATNAHTHTHTWQVIRHTYSEAKKVLYAYFVLFFFPFFSDLALPTLWSGGNYILTK